MMKRWPTGKMPTPQQMAQLAGGGQRAPRPKMPQALNLSAASRYGSPNQT